MADIQQWRRMIQPTRTRTPAVGLEDVDTALSPTTPRKGLKPKFSSYFTQHANNTGHSRKESSPLQTGDDDFPTWPADDPYPSPDADVLIDTVMCRILASPYETLDPRFNGILLQIFEGFRNLADEKQRLLAKAEQDSDRLAEMEGAMQRSARQWNFERQEYKAEVKRLEVRLSKGNRGLAEVTLARQDSVLRTRDAVSRRPRARKHDTLDTIFRFIEKSQRYEEQVWSPQRAVMRNRSPSADMRRLSKTLMAQGSSHPDLPVGTLTDGPSTLAEASYLEDNPPEIALDSSRRTTPDPKTSLSEDSTFSSFSCAGDLLPEEAANSHRGETAGTESDFAAMKRIAEILAKRRNVDADAVIPKLSDMFAAPTPDKTTHARAQSAMASTSFPAPTATAPPARKNTKLRAKASGLFNKLRPQLNIDTTVTEGQRFSFETGDDSALRAPDLIGTPRAMSSTALASMEAARVRGLRKCVSTPLLTEQGVQGGANSPERGLSPVAQSPTSSTPASESKRISKIPTPVHTPCLLARPRQEREDSESSLLTAIKHSVEVDRRSDSVGSPGHSSPPAGRVDLAFGSHSATTNRLLQHTKALRGDAFATVAATRAAETTTQADGETMAVHAKRPSVQSTSGKERLRENARPVNSPEHYVDRQDWY